MVSQTSMKGGLLLVLLVLAMAASTSARLLGASEGALKGGSRALLDGDRGDRDRRDGDRREDGSYWRDGQWRRDDYYRGDDNDCYRRGDCRGRDDYRGGLVNRIVGDVIGRRLLNWVEGRDEPRGPIGDILDDIRWHHDAVDKALDEKRWEIRHDVADVDHHY